MVYLHSDIMPSRTILKSPDFDLTIQRLCYELAENHDDFAGTAIIGLQPRGAYLARRIRDNLLARHGVPDIVLGNLDVTFYRDDFRRRERPLLPNATEMDFLVEGKKVILVDDVLFTGRTARAGMDAVLSFGRPRQVELLVLIDRRYSRHLPIQPDYVGKRVDSIASQRVKVLWKEADSKDKVILVTTDESET